MAVTFTRRCILRGRQCGKMCGRAADDCVNNIGWRTGFHRVTVKSDTDMRNGLSNDPAWRPPADRADAIVGARLHLMTTIRRLPLAAQVGLLAIVYFVAAKLSLALAIPPGYATAVWPPSGVAVAAVLMLGNRVWPGVWLGAAAVNFTINSSAFAAVAIGTGNTLEALAAAILI